MITWLQRQLNVLDYTLSSLMRRCWKNLSMVLLYTMLVFIVASVLLFTHALRREAELILADSPDLIVQRMVAGRHDPISLAYAEEISRIRGVSEVRPRFWGYYYDRINGANYTIQVADNRGLEPGSIAVGAGIAGGRNLQQGDLITLNGADGLPRVMELQEIFTSASDLLTVDLLLMRMDDFRNFFDFPEGKATDLAVSIPNPREIATIAAKVAERFPDCRPIMKEEILHTYASIFDWRGGMVIVIVGMAALSFLIFCWDRAGGLSAAERHEIGVLKSIGWDTGDVLLLKFWEGTVLSMTAFIAGTVAAYLHVFLADAPLFSQALKGWGVLYPDFRLTPFLDLNQVGVLFVLTVLPYLAATILPSWRAACIDPDAAMRS